MTTASVHVWPISSSFSYSDRSSYSSVGGGGGDMPSIVGGVGAVLSSFPFPLSFEVVEGSFNLLSASHFLRIFWETGVASVVV